MKLFVDTASVKEIEALAALGILDGVTTNPSLLARESGDYRHILKQMCQIVQGPVSAEVVATDAEGMLREGRDLASIDEHIVIKVPFTRDGVRGVQDTCIGRAARQRHADLFSRAGVAGGEGWRGLRQSVCWTPGRHRDNRDEPDPRDRRDVRQRRVFY